jgi:hypothetical protein
MLKVKNISILAFSKDFLDVSWEVEDTVEDIRDYDFFVQRSEGIEGPYDEIGGPLADEFMFRDVQAPLFHRWRQLYYRIRTVNRATSEEEISPSNQPIASKDLIAAEIQRLEFIRLNEFVGRRAIVMQKRTFGQRCVTCWDVIKQRIRISRCKDCFGVGFVRGYMKPVETLIQIEPSTQTEQLQDTGKTQHNVVSARAFIFPFLKPGDMVVEAENNRWRVTSSFYVEQLRHPVAQQVALIQIPDTDIEYIIPLDIGSVLDKPSPIRAFHNFANIDSAIKGVEKVTI